MKFRYNSMSDAGKSLAQRAKRVFAKHYPDVKVGIDSREGWITVDGKKAVNMSSASSRPMDLDDVVDQMKQTNLGRPISSRPSFGTWKQPTYEVITKRQLRRIIRESLDSMYGEDNLEAWKGAHAGRSYDDASALPENIAQLAYDAGAAGERLPQEIEDIEYDYPEDYAQAIEAYEDGLADNEMGV